MKVRWYFYYQKAAYLRKTSFGDINSKGLNVSPPYLVILIVEANNLVLIF